MSYKIILITLGFLLTGFGVSCTDSDDDSASTPSIFEGDRRQVGDGEAWTRVVLAPDGSPQEVTAVFTSGALSNLPTGHTPPAHEFTLPMPRDARVEPYDHVTLDWNAHGHEPPGVYDLPHFDIHFYFIDGAARDRIGANDSMQFNRPLPADVLPPMYIETPGGVPRMGAHLIDAMSPEIAGTGAFTHTLIYGKYDGKINFIEPMTAMSFLEAKTEVTAPIRRPQRYSLPGHYPGEYSITVDENADTYQVSLLDLKRYE